MLIGLAVVAVAAVGGRDLWQRYGAKTTDDSWIAKALSWLGTYPVDIAAVIVGIFISVLGLYLIFLAVKPRPRTHVPVDSTASIWLRPVDIARKATHTAQEQTGTHHIRSQATRSRLRVQVQDDGNGELLRERLAASLAEQFQGLRKPPTINVKLTPGAQGTQEVTP